MLTESASCFCVANTQVTLFQRITPTYRRISGWSMSFFVCGSFKHSVSTGRFDIRTIRKSDTIVSQYHPVLLTRLQHWSISVLFFSEEWDFQMIDNLLVTVHAFPWPYVDVSFRRWYMNCSTNFGDLSFSWHMALTSLKHMSSVLSEFK